MILKSGWVHPDTIVYPESDGKPMSDNTKQGEWIVRLFANLQALFRENARAFVAADLLWYPVEGHPEIRLAPDVLVVFGRDQYHRGSYLQWVEEGVPVTVVFEILSPSNSFEECIDKIAFYEEHGAEELYFYNPDKNRLEVYLRQGEFLRRQRPGHGFVSPRLGIRFDLSGPEMVVFRPDGRPFLTLAEVEEQRRAEQQRAELAEQQASQERDQRLATQQRAEQAEQRAEQAEQGAARLAELSRKARRGQASPEELAELERLEGEHLPPTI